MKAKVKWDAFILPQGMGELGVFNPKPKQKPFW
jgi:hypothetical protein